MKSHLYLFLLTNWLLTSREITHGLGLTSAIGKTNSVSQDRTQAFPEK